MPFVRGRPAQERHVVAYPAFEKLTEARAHRPAAFPMGGGAPENQKPNKFILLIIMMVIILPHIDKHT